MQDQPTSCLSGQGLTAWRLQGSLPDGWQLLTGDAGSPGRRSREGLVCHNGVRDVTRKIAAWEAAHKRNVAMLSRLRATLKTRRAVIIGNGDLSLDCLRTWIAGACEDLGAAGLSVTWERVDRLQHFQNVTKANLKNHYDAAVVALTDAATEEAERHEQARPS